MPRFLNLFDYESEGSNKDNIYFTNCVMLHDFGDLKKGDKVHSIAMNLGLYAWKKSWDDWPDYDESAPLTASMYHAPQ